MWYIDIHIGNTPIHIKKILKLKSEGERHAYTKDAKVCRGGQR